MVHGLEAKYYGKIKFSYLDASDPATQDYQRSLGFRFQPEMYLLDGDGNVLQKWIGFVTEEQLELVFVEYLQ